MSTTGKTTYNNGKENRMFNHLMEDIPTGWIRGQIHSNKHDKFNGYVPNKEELIKAYLQTGATLSSIGRVYNTSHKTVGVWLKRYDIPIKSHKQASQEANAKHRKTVKPNKEIFNEVYTTSSIIDICKIFNVTQETVAVWAHEYGVYEDLSIRVKRAKEKQFADIQFSKEKLIETYDCNLPLSALACKLGVSNSHIRTLFKKHEIQATQPNRSNGEISLFESLGDGWESTNRQLIKPYELDMVNHDRKLAVEFCGLYWHAETSGNKSPSYHYDKLKLTNDAGYRLITVFEIDDMKKIRSLINNNDRIFARNTSVEKITNTFMKTFNEAHHLSNHAHAKYSYGLFHNGECVMAISFGKSRFSGNQEYECIRMTSHSDYSVVGGASKLFAAFRRDIKPHSIVTFADLRFGTGKVYEHCGFTRVDNTGPNYWYFSRKLPYMLHSRLKFQKHKIKSQLELFDPNMTEYQNMLANGFDRIWDCGSAKYVSV